MADKKRKSADLANLLPNTVTIQDGDMTLRVAGDASENRTLNYLLAAKIRALMEKQLKQYDDLDRPMLPKEINDMVAAAAKLAEFSANVYKDGEPVPSEKPVESVTVEATDFSQLSKKPDDNRTSEESPRTSS